MDFELTAEQKMVVEAASDIARDFGPEYWREKDKKHEFPCVHIQRDSKLISIMTKEEMNQLETLDELIAAVKVKLNEEHES